MMHHRSHYATSGDDDDLAPLMGARQRRLTGDVPYRDDPVSKEDLARIAGCRLVALPADLMSHTFAFSAMLRAV